MASLIKFSLVVLVAAAVSADLGYAPAHPTHHSAPGHSAFEYAVKDEYSQNDFGHSETRDGYKTEGSYYVALPDGRLQKVTYYVDGDSGYVAQVSYVGEAHFPEYNPHQQPHHKPVHHAPIHALPHAKPLY